MYGETKETYCVPKRGLPWSRKFPGKLCLASSHRQGDRSCFKVLLLVLEAPRTVTEIVKSFRIKQSLVSQHLKILRECGPLKGKKGPFLMCQLCGREVRGLLDLAQEPASKGSQS